MTSEIQVAFLGLAERAIPVLEGETPFKKLNILGLKQAVVTYILPLPLSAFKWVFAFRNISSSPAAKLHITNLLGEEIGCINLQFQVQAMTGDTVDATTTAQSSEPVRSMVVGSEGWIVLPVPVEETLLASSAGRYVISMAQPNGTKEMIGAIDILLANVDPLTEHRIAAIRSDPHAAKAIRIQIGCKQCPSKVQAWVGLDRKPNEDGWLWYEDVPDHFVCGCGATKIDLYGIKHNLHALLGHPFVANASEISFTPLYEAGALEALRQAFVRLLSSDPPEEAIQRFMQENPILLHQFPAEKLFFKPAILTFFNTDFAVVTPQKELVLIEIENTKTRLMTKSGDEAAPLRHALDQVRNWLHVVDEHRLAVLDSLSIDRKMVSSVRGVVIAGRDRGYDAEHLRRLKGLDRGRIGFLTFDDLAFSMAALVARLRNL
jgi:hypothetical protein